MALRTRENSDSLVELFGTFTKVELKQELMSRKLTVSGNKPELVQRLLSYFQELDYMTLTDEQINAEINLRGLPVEGDRETLVNQLLHHDKGIIAVVDPKEIEEVVLEAEDSYVDPAV